MCIILSCNISCCAVMLINAYMFCQYLTLILRWHANEMEVELYFKLETELQINFTFAWSLSQDLIRMGCINADEIVIKNHFNIHDDTRTKLISASVWKQILNSIWWMLFIRKKRRGHTRYFSNQALLVFLIFRGAKKMFYKVGMFS